MKQLLYVSEGYVQTLYHKVREATSNQILLSLVMSIYGSLLRIPIVLILVVNFMLDVWSHRVKLFMGLPRKRLLHVPIGTVVASKNRSSRAHSIEAGGETNGNIFIFNEAHFLWVVENSIDASNSVSEEAIIQRLTEMEDRDKRASLNQV
ncbi:hypothetical protein VNO78_13749 [Psophocarpus tetragonolobus]|uniref:Uncharacterized protein n=1 Tax=Psophocarpus tetragonolobus TaxID=3891 RepID=A0AAN9SPJ2_PSOTE